MEAQGTVCEWTQNEWTGCFTPLVHLECNLQTSVPEISIKIWNMNLVICFMCLWGWFVINAETG